MLHTTGSPIPPAGVVVPLALTAVVYVRGLSRVRARQPRVLPFIAAWTVLGLALATPLHDAGQRALSWHMAQHVLLMAVAAPLLVWSRPSAVLLRGLPERLRRPLIRITRACRPAYEWLTGIAVAAVLHGALLWVWHTPALYNSGVRNAIVHDAQHITLLAAALLFWASVLAALTHRARTGPAVLSLFVTMLHMSLLAVLFTFARTPWYDAYVLHPDPIADQQLAGLIMWVPGALPYLAGALAIVWRLLTHQRPHKAVARRASAAVALVVLLGACAGDVVRDTPAGTAPPEPGAASAVLPPD